MHVAIRPVIFQRPGNGWHRIFQPCCTIENNCSLITFDQPPFYGQLMGGSFHRTLWVEQNAILTNNIVMDLHNLIIFERKGEAARLQRPFWQPSLILDDNVARDTIEHGRTEGQWH